MSEYAATTSLTPEQARQQAVVSLTSALWVVTSNTPGALAMTYRQGIRRRCVFGNYGLRSALGLSVAALVARAVTKADYFQQRTLAHRVAPEGEGEPQPTQI